MTTTRRTVLATWQLVGLALVILAGVVALHVLNHHAPETKADKCEQGWLSYHDDKEPKPLISRDQWMQTCMAAPDL